MRLLHGLVACPLHLALLLVSAHAGAEDPAPLTFRLEGQVLDADGGTPLAMASVQVGLLHTTTDAEGRFGLGDVAVGDPAFVKLPGYELGRLSVPGPSLLVILQPQVIRAAYLSYYGVSSSVIRERVLALVDETELNAVVIDAKGDRGWITYPTTVPAAVAAGAKGPVQVGDIEGMLADLHKRGVYSIARIVCFKDNVLALARPDLAIRDVRAGRPWVDAEGQAWVDPFREEVWAYVSAVAQEAAAKGFDEVQLDYVRFPTDGRTSAARYAEPNTEENRVRAISSFLSRLHEALAPTGVFLSADVFGYTSFNLNDTDIGQRVEDMAPFVDYLSPMAYPSAYHAGIPRFRDPLEHPFEVVEETVRRTLERAVGTPMQVRPWVQDFNDYAFDGRTFGKEEVGAQLRGADSGGAVGWMLWNPRNQYTSDALAPGEGR